MKKLLVNEISRDLLSLIPIFHEKLIKPSEGLLGGGLSRILFFTLSIIKTEGLITMTELSAKMEMPKQQMTKIINRLCEVGFVERLYDKADRRIIRIGMADPGKNYISDYMERLLELIAENIGNLEDHDIKDMKNSVECLVRILPKMGKIKA